MVDGSSVPSAGGSSSIPRGSAWHVALRRAAHQLFDDPVVFHDPFAVPLLGAAGAAELARTPRRRAWSRSLRAFAVARSRYAEQQLALAVSAGVQQYCLLGAVFDTFSLRNPWDSLRVIELDRPEMLARKRAMLREAGFPLPACLVQVEADLTALLSPLPAVDPEQPCFFAMLGVAPYLELHALRNILARVRGCGRGSGIVFDYRLPRAMLGAEEQRQHDSLMSRLTAAGEPFRSFVSPPEMTALLRDFARVEQLDAAALHERYFSGRADGLRILGDAVRLAVAWA